jgi:acyl carrier protein
MQEHPELGVAVADLDPWQTVASSEALARLVRHLHGASLVALRGSGLFAQRLRERSVRRLQHGPLFCKDASYLVAGGLGGFGPILAEWLLENGAGAVVLAGRRITASVRRRVARLDAASRISLQRADVADRIQVDALLAKISRTHLPLRGVFHTALVLDDRLLINQTLDSYRAVLRPKLTGVQTLDSATRGLELDHFVLFSSVAGIFGSAGQANYAAACAAMDSVAIGRRIDGRTALSIAWGPWNYAGSPSAAHMRDSDFRPIAPEAGLEWLGRLLADAGDLPAQVIASHIKPQAVRRMNGAITGTVARAPAVDVREAATARELDGPAILRELTARVGRRIGAHGKELPQDRTLATLGLDSLAVLELRNELSEDLGVMLTPRRLINAAGLADIAEQILRQFLQEAELAALKDRFSGQPDSIIDTLSDAEVEQALHAFAPQLVAK